MNTYVNSTEHFCELVSTKSNILHIFTALYPRILLSRITELHVYLQIVNDKLHNLLCA